MNPHLLKDLTERGLWNGEMKNKIIAYNGSIQVRHGSSPELVSGAGQFHYLQSETGLGLGRLYANGRKGCLPARPFSLQFLGQVRRALLFTFQPPEWPLAG